MDKEQEVLLRKRLEEGVKIKDLFPHIYRSGKRLYYEIHLCERTIKAILVLERKNPSSQEEFEMKIVEIYRYLDGQKHQLNSELLYKNLTFKINPLFTSTRIETSPMCLNGTIYLIHN